jgi:hypothetical protein
LIVQRYIAEQNIQNFKAALAEETDGTRRALLERLLAEEMAKLAEARAAEDGPDADKPR